VIEAAGQRYNQTPEFRHLGSMINERANLTRDLDCRGRAAVERMKKYARELFDRPGAPF